jgi:hypothetical protein
MARRVTFETARKIALSLPGVVEGPCYGTPGFRVKGKLIARVREDGETLVVRTDLDTRDALLEANPGVYHLTDHYRGHPWVLIHLSRVREGDLRERLEDAWRGVAPKRLVAEHDARR